MGTVHDSFWTHAADIDLLRDITRLTFVSQYSDDILENLRNEVRPIFLRYSGHYASAADGDVLSPLHRPSLPVPSSPYPPLPPAPHPLRCIERSSSSSDTATMSSRRRSYSRSSASTITSTSSRVSFPPRATVNNRSTPGRHGAHTTRSRKSRQSARCCRRARRTATLTSKRSRILTSFSTRLLPLSSHMSAPHHVPCTSRFSRPNPLP